MFDDGDAFHGLPQCFRSENRAVADDLDGRRAVGPARARDLTTGRPGSALQDLGERKGGCVPAQSLPHQLREAVEQGYRERTPFDDERRGDAVLSFYFVRI